MYQHQRDCLSAWNEKWTVQTYVDSVPRFSKTNDQKIATVYSNRSILWPFFIELILPVEVSSALLNINSYLFFTYHTLNIWIVFIIFPLWLNSGGLSCRVFIPDENLVWCPENLMTAVLAQVHYLPDNWRGNAHTSRVRNELSQLFQYKAVSVHVFFIFF